MIYRFADCELDIAAHELRRGGAPVRVEPQVFDLVACLAEAGGELVSYDGLLQRVWGGRIVSDAAIAARISAARAALGDDGRRQAVIRTVPRRGVQMAAPVTSDAPQAGGRSPLRAAPPDQAIRYATSADGSSVAWAATGEGPPLLRGGHWLSNLERDPGHAIWGPWLERLGRGRRLVRYDPRGTGTSPADCGEITVRTYTEDLAAVADAAGLDRFDIFAASQSAAPALTFAAAHPGRVRRIVTYGGYAQGSRVRDGGAGDGMSAGLTEMIRHGWGRPDGGHMRALASLALPGASPDQLSRFVEMQVASASAERAVEVRDAIADFDAVEVLGQVKAPVLVAHATGDALHPFSQAQLMVRELPDARLLPLDSINHVLLPDEPAFARLMEAVDAFLAEAG